MLTTFSISGNLHEAAAAINKRGISRMVLSLHPISAGSTIAVFRTDGYPDFCYLREKLGLPEWTAKEWYQGYRD